MVGLSIVEPSHARETNLATSYNFMFSKKKKKDKYLFLFSFCNLARNSEANKNPLEKNTLINVKQLYHTMEFNINMNVMTI